MATNVDNEVFMMVFTPGCKGKIDCDGLLLAGRIYFGQRECAGEAFVVVAPDFYSVMHVVLWKPQNVVSFGHCGE